jgi:hypothetical protein
MRRSAGGTWWSGCGSVGCSVTQRLPGEHVRRADHGPDLAVCSSQPTGTRDAGGDRPGAGRPRRSTAGPEGSGSRLAAARCCGCCAPCPIPSPPTWPCWAWTTLRCAAATATAACWWTGHRPPGGPAPQTETPTPSLPGCATIPALRSSVGTALAPTPTGRAARTPSDPGRRSLAPVAQPDWLRREDRGTPPHLPARTAYRRAGCRARSRPRSSTPGRLRWRCKPATAQPCRGARARSEGNVNRIKLRNRQLDGRAGFDLLRNRVLLSA